MADDKAPYFVTAIVAALAWTLTHAVDRLAETPYLKYDVSNTTTADKYSSYITIQNITRNITFKDVNLLVTASPQDVVISGSVIPHQPAYEGDRQGITEGRTFDFTFPVIQPGWRFDVSVVHRTDAPVFIRLSTDQQSIYATRPSAETCLVEHEFGALVFIIAIGGLALAVSLWRTGKAPSSAVASPQATGPCQGAAAKAPQPAGDGPA